MTRGIIKYMATLAITVVCGGCHNVSATVEDTAAWATSHFLGAKIQNKKAFCKFFVIFFHFFLKC